MGFICILRGDIMTRLKLRTFVDDNIFRLEEKFNKWTDNSDVDISVSYIVKDIETGNWILSVFYSIPKGDFVSKRAKETFERGRDF